MFEAVKYNKSIINHKDVAITYEQSKIYIGSGTSDKVSVYKEGYYLYILSINTGLDYVALDIYNLYDDFLIENLFFSSNQLREVEESHSIPKDSFLELSDEEMISILNEYSY